MAAEQSEKSEIAYFIAMKMKIYTIILVVGFYLFVRSLPGCACITHSSKHRCWQRSSVQHDRKQHATGSDGHDTSNAGREKAPFTMQAQVWQDLLSHEPNWFYGREAKRIAETVLIYQRASGGWPKNIDFTEPLSKDVKRQLLEYPDEPASTIDNGATFTQLYFLVRMYQAQPNQRYALSFLKGLDYLLAAQYDNGGWPQFYPLRPGYYSHITFNDDAMIGVMRLLRDLCTEKIKLDFIDHQRRRKATQALSKGIDCILKTQIKADGKLTAWCAQYDEKTLHPAGARTYEHPSLSGDETVGIVQFLMEIEPPTEEIINAVQHAVAWLQQVKIEGIRVVERPDASSPTGYDKIVVKDADAPPMWARFYRIGSNEPFFSDRDGRIYHNLAEISLERRNEYGWLGYWPQALLNELYEPWQKKWAPERDAWQQ
ncbi:pectate lyase [candidate division KSB1 bacterium]|nr:pectate lyase [candidate division KSB1 bacterium]